MKAQPQNTCALTCAEMICLLFADLCPAEDEATVLESPATECMAEDALMQRQMSENYSPPIVPNYPHQSRRLPLTVAGGGLVQMLTPQQALEAAACGKARGMRDCTTTSGVASAASDAAATQRVVRA